MKTLLALVLLVPSLASANSLVHVTRGEKQKVYRAVNQYLADANPAGLKIKPVRGLTVLINDKGHGLAFHKAAVSKDAITAPWGFTVGKGGTVTRVDQLYMAHVNALKGDF